VVVSLPVHIMNLKFKTTNYSGFTLLETVIAIGLLLIVIVSLTTFTFSILDIRTKLTSVSEVQGNMRLGFDVMSQKIRSASGVDILASTFTTDPGVLVLTMSDPAKNPTTFRLTANNGQLQMQEGVSAPVVLTSDEVRISQLIFNIGSPAGEQENIRIQMTTDYVYGENSYAAYSETLQTSVSTRN